MKLIRNSVSDSRVCINMNALLQDLVEKRDQKKHWSISNVRICNPSGEGFYRFLKGLINKCIELNGLGKKFMLKRGLSEVSSLHQKQTYRGPGNQNIPKEGRTQPEALQIRLDNCLAGRNCDLVNFRLQAFEACKAFRSHIGGCTNEVENIVALNLWHVACHGLRTQNQTISLWGGNQSLAWPQMVAWSIITWVFLALMWMFWGLRP